MLVECVVIDFSDIYKIAVDHTIDLNIDFKGPPSIE